VAISKEPKPHPSELDYVPPDSRPYKVTPNDNWWTLAEREDVKFSGMSALDLCYFNFKTRKPAEINWYLHHKVGCRKQTRDGNNYMFSAADNPGIVYLPKQGHPPPAGDVKRKRAGRLNTWVGVVLKGGTQFVVVGIETVGGVAVSLDDGSDWMGITASVNRLGPGWGASGGLAIVYIAGVSNPMQLNGHQEGGWDFNLALGSNWGKAAQAGSKMTKFKPLIDAVLKVGARTPSAFKLALKASPDKYADLVKACRTFNETLGIDGSEPKVIMIDIPSPWTSGGVEASVFFGIANFNAVWDNL
jgi:hypothetical protein